MMRAIEGHYALAFDSPSLRDRVIGDSEGDAMDALILAIAASQADADQVAESAAHADAHPSEAFIFV